MRVLPNPTLFGMRVSVLFGLYRRRLRDHTVTELLAGGGIAIGVALVFGVLVANGSIIGSVREDVRAVGGSADLELVARSPATFSARLADRIASLPGVERSASLLREYGVIVGPRGSERVQFVGLDPGLITLGGFATKNLGSGELLLARGVGLPSQLASAIGAETRRMVTLVVNGSSSRVRVRAVLNSGTIGPLASVPLVAALLPYAQAIAGTPGQVNQVLIKPRAGSERQVTAELRALAGNTLDVGPADNEVRLAETAAVPVNRSTSLFVAIAAMVGFLLALNAMLLTIPERRRAIADMRIQGFDVKQVLAIVVFQALVLGIVASCVGVVAGDLLARTLFHEVPSYLATAFPVTGNQTVHAGTVLVAFGCGLLAALLVSLSPIFDLRSDRPVDAVFHETGEPGQTLTHRTTVRAAALGAILIVLVSVCVLLDAALTVFGGVVLALAALCFIPLLFQATCRALKGFARRWHGGMVAVAAIEINGTATRSVALAGVAALAVYGVVAVGGARHDLLRGLDNAITEEWGSAPVWVTPDGNIFDADGFRVENPANPFAGAGTTVASVHIHQGGFLDLGTHRIWVRAVPANNSTMVLSSQLLKGDLASATARMREGGWATVSSGLAEEHHLHTGGRLLLPTPSGIAPLRVAAITTNTGWPSGTISVNTRDYSRYWLSTTPTAISLSLRPGVTPAAGRDLVKGLLKSQPSLRVQTSQERIAEVESSVRQGLRTLSEISTLLLVVAALALATALSTAIYQRRARLSSLKAQGFDRGQLWRCLLLESAIVLGIGCLDGVVMGVYAHALGDRYLRLDVGFPAPFSVGGAQVVLTLLLMLGIALAIIALPGYSAAGVSARASFQE
ncbi:MAG TPA: FtsX-like permease family protein [Solirubrobacteraceae bacterium]|jgi:putative ABC transport system permease protein